MDDSFDILEDLTPSQREAVTHTTGPMMVVAGAGSGKTRVVTRRIAYLIRHGVWPSQILAMTFTNKAANEMRQRVADLTGCEPPRCIGTFHSCCARFLRQDIEQLDDGRTSNFVIYDEDDKKAIVKKIIKGAEGLSEKLEKNLLKTLSGIISDAKSSSKTVAEYVFIHGLENATTIIELADQYESLMRSLNAVDFDDLLLLMKRLLEEKKAVREVYQNRFRHLLIDEYQDTNALQYQLMKLLVGPEQNIHVTGDPDQSIYSWRGADYTNIMNFTKDFPDAKIVRLEQNYRSTKAILEVANNLIVKNTYRLEKNLYTDNDDGVPVLDVTTGTNDQECAWIVSRVRDIISTGASYKDIAVFFRTNSLSRGIEEAFVREGIPYQLIGGLRFYERKEIKDILAFLKLYANHCDALSLERVAGFFKGVGDKTLARCEYAARQYSAPILDFLASDSFEKHYTDVHGKKPPASLQPFTAWCAKLLAIPNESLTNTVNAIWELSGLEDAYQDDPTMDARLENLKELFANIEKFDADNEGATLEDFLEQVALVADVDSMDGVTDAVMLMTLHSSKGLEFPYVFILGVEEGLIPHSNALEEDEADETGTNAHLEEERRLFYVGITRAQKELALTHCRERYSMVYKGDREPSRFLNEIPATLVRKLSVGTTQRHTGSYYDYVRRKKKPWWMD